MSLMTSGTRQVSIMLTVRIHFFRISRLDLFCHLIVEAVTFNAMLMTVSVFRQFTGHLISVTNSTLQSPFDMAITQKISFKISKETCDSLTR